MTENIPKPSSDVLGKVELSRRGFVKSLTIGTGFAVPFIASYPLDGVRVSTAYAGGFSNMSNMSKGSFFRYLIHKILRFFGFGST